MLLCYWRHWLKVGLESILQSPPITGGVASAVAATTSLAFLPGSEGQVAAYIAAVLCGVVVAALTAFVKYMTTTAVQGQERIAKAVEANTRVMNRGLNRVSAQTERHSNNLLIALGHPNLITNSEIEDPDDEDDIAPVSRES